MVCDSIESIRAHSDYCVCEPKLMSLSAFRSQRIYMHIPPKEPAQTAAHSWAERSVCAVFCVIFYARYNVDSMPDLRVPPMACLSSRVISFEHILSWRQEHGEGGHGSYGTDAECVRHA